MKKIDLGQAITILANLGVIGGLIFVGLQLQQDRQIARQQMVHSSTNLYDYWADLLNEGAEVWSNGLAGDSLNDSESVQFHALAEAWHTRYYSAWFSVNEIGTTDGGLGFAREEALLISENPGLRDWWREFRELQKQTGRGGTYDEIIEEEIRRFGDQTSVHE